jgi:hypothetical protein
MTTQVAVPIRELAIGRLYEHRARPRWCAFLSSHS